MEDAWCRSRDPERLLDFYRDAVERSRPGAAAAARAWRLAASACCRSIWPLLEEGGEGRRAVEVAEAAAEGAATDADLHEAGEAVRRGRVVGRGYCWLDDSYIVALVCGPLDYAEFAAYAATAANPEAAATTACRWAGRCHRRGLEILAGQDLPRDLRDILENPFQQVTFDPLWVTPAVAAVAEVIYRERHFTDMPILGDALEEAGCADRAVLDHCHHQAHHVHGCWLLDRILAKR